MPRRQRGNYPLGTLCFPAMAMLEQQLVIFDGHQHRRASAGRPRPRHLQGYLARMA
jgi:hypothetical protein